MTYKKENVSLGCIDVDVEIQEDGMFDIYIAHAGSSGCHYVGLTIDEIGQHVAGYIECLSEQYRREKGEPNDH